MPFTPRSLGLRPIWALAALPIVLAALLGLAPPVTADTGLTMTAHALLQGHARQGSWFAIAVDVGNDGPAVTGELRVVGGVDGRTRFGTPVELATGSRKEYLLYAQPPAFGGSVNVDLISGDAAVATAKVAVAVHDTSQLVVGVMAENAARAIGEINLLPAPNGSAAVIVPLAPADLPERIQAWAPLDRLVWQDTDAAALSPGQVAALRAWVAGGGALVIVGGTAGADSLTGFPDDLLPYRPSGVIDIDPSVVRPVLGGLPAGAAPVAAFAGTLARGRALASAGDRVVAADMPFGSGTVTLLGFDPTTGWIAGEASLATPLWRHLLPQRVAGTASLVDDSAIVAGAGMLPSLTLPATSGLLVLLVGYILLIGPVNYIVLRRLDRREWAWVTVPALIVAFTIGAFGYGALTRGSSVIVHEVAIVRGGPGTDQAQAQSWIGIFSPSRGSFGIRVPGDTLLSGPMATGGAPSGAGALDILEGDPSQIRDLAVGYGSLRTVMAQGSATGPVVDADLHLQNGLLVGSLTNHSPRTLVMPSMVLGSAVQNLDDLAPGASVAISLAVASPSNNIIQLSDKVVGSVNWGLQADAATQRRMIRRSVVDEISMDPTMGFSTGLPAGSATLLAWGEDPVVPVTIDGEQVRHLADILYQIPIRYAIDGIVTFQGDLLPSTVLAGNQSMFQKGPGMTSLGTGSATLSYQPVAFAGTLTPSAVTLALTSGDLAMPGGQPIPATTTVRCDPATTGCAVPRDGVPDLDILDVRTGDWVALAHPSMGQAYALPDPTRWVDPGTGEIRVRIVNQTQDMLGFSLPLAITGTLR